jgi:hypothetical protein
MIWEYLFPDMYLFPGPCDDFCRHKTHGSRWSTVCAKKYWCEAIGHACSYNDHQFHPLLTSKSLYIGMKHILDQTPVTADFPFDGYTPLKTSVQHRVRKLMLDEAVFPIVSLHVGPLEFAGEELLEAFPQLQEIEFVDHSGYGRNGLTYPQAIRLEILGCLKYSDGPSNPPQLPSCDGDTLLDFVMAEIAGPEQQHNLASMEGMMKKRRLTITSIYWYQVSVTEHLSWPFCERRQAMDKMFKTRIIWDERGMDVLDVVDLRDEEWWDDFVRRTPGWGESPLKSENTRSKSEEVYSTTDDWDMLKILWWTKTFNGGGWMLSLYHLNIVLCSFLDLRFIETGSVGLRPAINVKQTSFAGKPFARYVACIWKTSQGHNHNANAIAERF